MIAAFLFRQTIVASEAPTYTKITGYAAGYWLWLTSAVIATIGVLVGTLCVIALRRNAKREKNSFD